MRTSRISSALLVLIALVSSGFAQQTAKGKAAENATVALLQMNSAYQQTPAAQKAQLLTRLAAIAAQRQQLLSSLMQTNPADVIRVALPSNITGTLPLTIKRYVEQRVQTQGTLEIAIEDSAASSKIHYGLTTAAGKLALHFTDQAPTNLLTGSVLKVNGVQLGGDLALACCSSTSSTSTAAPASGPLPYTFGPQNTLVILVNFQDNQIQPWTVSAVQNMVFTTASNFWLENSFQQTWLTGDVAGWFTLPITSATCNTGSIQTYAQQAAQSAGFVLSNYNHFVYMFPQTSACSWMGYSFIGGRPSNSWVNGYLYQQVISHELGHALGLYHSHGLNCGTLPYISSGCTQYEYADSYETMGSSNFNGYSMHYNAFQKERLGWLNYSSQPPITMVSSSGTYTLSPYETQDTNPKALKILQSSSSAGNVYYYVEARQAIGFDAILANNVPGYSNVLSGVVVRTATAGSANSSDILNMNPASGWGNAMALDVGQSYTDATAGITIAPTSVSTTGATVQVTLTSPPCTTANPTISISPVQSAYVLSGSVVNFTLTVKDNDSTPCAPATFNLNDTIPAGWMGTWNTSALSLSPGGSGSATLTVTSPTGTPDGFYNVGMSTTNASAPTYTASTSATYVISTPASVSIAVATNQPSYSAGQSVAITVTVLSGTSPDAGASVNATITSPGGTTTMLSGTTGSSGTVTFTYKLGKRAKLGTYAVQASLSSTGASATTGASTTFVVQ